jgi:hypothetical protein
VVAEAAGAVTARKILTGQAFWQALVAAGVCGKDELARRVVIDAQADHAVVMYVERWADERLLQVVQTLDGVEVRGVPREPDHA